MKQYNCPDCNRTDSCDYCYRTTDLPSHFTYYENTQSDPRSPCYRCNNNPKNGGSGICHCILGNQFIY